MSARPERMKMCWNCEGNVSIIAEDCPYCQVVLMPKEMIQQKNLESFSTPPRAPIPFNPLNQSEPSDDEVDAELTVESSTEDLQSLALTMALLMGGAVFLLFSLVLWYFSNDGFLVLRWDSSYWYIYLSFGISMLYFGYRMIRNASSEV